MCGSRVEMNKRDVRVRSYHKVDPEIVFPACFGIIETELGSGAVCSGYITFGKLVLLRRTTRSFL